MLIVLRRAGGSKLLRRFGIMSPGWPVGRVAAAHFPARETLRVDVSLVNQILARALRRRIVGGVRRRFGRRMTMPPKLGTRSAIAWPLAEQAGR